MNTYVDLNTQVEDSGHRILWESTENPSEMEAVFRPEVFWIFFRWIPANCLYFPVGTGWKSSEKIRESSGYERYEESETFILSVNVSLSSYTKSSAKRYPME
jgi:hypothetical protein